MNCAQRNILPPELAPDTVRTGLFLVGAERSGTTMLRLMLDHHPGVAWLNEFEYAVDMMTDGGAAPPMNQYRSFLDSHRVFRATGFSADTALTFPDLVRGFLEQRRAAAGKPIVGATVHRHFDRLLHVWPDARFVHLVRDPRDVAPSVIKMGWAGNVYHATERWLRAEQTWDRVRARVGEERCCEVRFESLLAEPTQELSRVCAFIGVPFDDGMLAFHEDTTYERPDRGAAQRWRSGLTPRQIGLIEGRAGDLLALRGYEPSGEPIVRPSSTGLRLLGVQNRISRIRWRIDRYGLWLYGKGMLARRLSPNGAWPKILRRMQDIDRGHLR